MRHPEWTLNPKKTHNERCPVFQNRTPGWQPNISHDCEVVGSTFFKNPKTFQNCSSNVLVGVICRLVCLRQICSHCTWCNIFLVFYFFHSQVSNRLADKKKPRLLAHKDQCYTCERWLLQLACRSPCIPSYRWCYLSAGSGTATTGLESRANVEEDWACGTIPRQRVAPCL